MNRHHTKTVSDLLHTREHDRAAAYLSSLPEQDFSAEPELLILRGRVQGALQNWGLCAKAWREALRVYPGHGEAMLKLGKALFELTDFKSAVEVLEPCLNRAELWENAALLTARSLTRLGKYDRALRLWRQFAERRLRSPESERQWLRCAAAAMRYEEAASALRHAIQNSIDLGGLELEAMLTIWESSSDCLHHSLDSFASPLFRRSSSGRLVSAVAHYKNGRFSTAEDLFSSDDPALPKPLIEFARWCRLRSMLQVPVDPDDVIGQAVDQTLSGQLSISQLADLIIQVWKASPERLKRSDDVKSLTRRLSRLGEQLAPLIDKLNLCHVPELTLSIWQAVRMDLPINRQMRSAAARAFNAIGDFKSSAQLLLGEDGGTSLDAGNFKLLIRSLINAGQFAHALELLDAASPWKNFSRTNPGIWFENQLLRCALYNEQRDWPALETCARALISINSTRKDGYLQLAIAHTSMLRLHEAEAAYVQALQLEPGNSAILVNLGTVYRMLDRTSEARDHYLKALRLGCSSPNLLQIIGDFVKSTGVDSDPRLFLSAIDDSPASDVTQMLARTIVLLSVSSADEVVAQVEADPEACKRDPLLACVAAKAYRGMNLGEKALSILLPHISTRNQLSHVGIEYFDTLILLGRFEEAQRFLESLPQLLANRRSRLLTCTKRMDLYWNLDSLPSAWQCYDDLPYVGAMRSRNSGLPFVSAGVETKLVDGDGLTLVCAVQGVGDEIRMASLYNDIIPKLSSLAFTCDPRLLSLFQRSFPGCQFLPSIRRDQSVMSPDILPAYAGLPDMELSRVMDFATYKVAVQADRVFLVSDMLKILRRERASFGTGRPYLVSDPGLAGAARARLQAIGGGRKVGITWQSENRAATRTMHYSAPETWDEIFALPGVDFISFQHGDCRAQIEAAEIRHGVRIHRLEDIDLKNDFETVASLISQLDAAIGPVVAFTELCASLGVPAAFMWRVPVGKWRLLPQNCGDIWHASGVPVFADSPADHQGLIAATAQQLRHWLGV